MWIAFLSALLDPLIVGTALVGVFLVKSPMQLRIIVAGVAMILSLSELIGGLQDPLLKILTSAAGAGLAGLLLAEASRMIIAPAAALILGGALAIIAWLRNAKAKSE
jgi:hypothetical protein